MGKISRHFKSSVYQYVETLFLCQDIIKLFRNLLTMSVKMRFVQ